ncbi:alpha/beta hydrolase [Rhodopirellula baltica]|nr:alpha/beta hydrolase [Rhodopirellula baltica]
MVDRAQMLYEAGYATVLIDFRGHGESGGQQITFGNLERFDATAAVEFARQAHPELPIGVIGVSLGGASAVLASPLDIDALVLESVYSTISDAVENRVRIRLGPIAPLASAALLFQLRYRLGIPSDALVPIDHVADVKCPVLILSGREDQQTTEVETRRMFEAASEPKSLWLIDGVGHKDLYRYAGDAYRERVLEFLDAHLPTAIE